MIHDELSCAAAREQLSARLDDERTDEAGLATHLAGCAACRAHERDLAALARDFAALRAPSPLADLWPRIARRARRDSFTPLLARLAAAILGFIGLGGTALFVERGAPEPAASRHLVERLATGAQSSLFAALPEYRVLRAFPVAEEPR